MASVRLKPRIGRVILFYGAVFAGILVPVGILLLVGFLGPPPYLLDREALGPGWADRTRDVNGATVTVTVCVDPSGAGEVAATIDAETPKKSFDKTLDVVRYVRSDDGRHGLILPLDEVVIHVEGRDREHVDEVVDGLPFVIENPRRNPVYVLFTEHLGAFFIGLTAYVALYGVAMARGGAWAARVEPPADSSAISADDLQARLLELNELDAPFQIRRKKRRYLIAEWRLADARWTTVFEKAGLAVAHSVRMKVDPQGRRVRVIDTHRRIQWSAGVARASWSFSFFRGISFYQVEKAAAYGLLLEDGRWKLDSAYDYSFNLNELRRPLVETVVRSGWSWQPVVTFFRLIGG